MHQTWLEYGPTENNAKEANADVRQCLSDMGTEFGIANYHDVVPQYFKKDIGNDGAFKFLYPYAMQIPGVMHIVDWVIRQSIQVLPFYPVWQGATKVILQTFHSQKLREHVANKIGTMDIDDDMKCHCIASLKHATGKFANWRWRTLWHAVEDLLRIEDAIKVAMASAQDPAKWLANRNKDNANFIKNIVEDAHFWNQCRVLKAVLGPLMRFTSWLQGCDCHGADAHHEAGSACPLKGCRARHMSRQVASLKDELRQLRDQLYPGQFGAVYPTDVFRVLTEVIYCFSAKMQWVDELQYVIWQVLISVSLE